MRRALKKTEDCWHAKPGDVVLKKSANEWVRQASLGKWDLLHFGGTFLEGDKQYGEMSVGGGQEWAWEDGLECSCYFRPHSLQWMVSSSVTTALPTSCPDPCSPERRSCSSWCLLCPLLMLSTVMQDVTSELIFYFNFKLNDYLQGLTVIILYVCLLL